MQQVVFDFELLQEQGSYFDLLALLCFAINKLKPDIQEKTFQEFKKNYESIIKQRNARFPGLLAKGKGRPTLYYELSEDVIRSIQSLFVSQEINNCAMLLAVTQAIDELIEPDINLDEFFKGKKSPVFDISAQGRQSAGVSEFFYSFDALNSVTKNSFGELVPKKACAWSKQGKRSMEGVELRPLSILQNYLWIPPDEEWTARHIALKNDLGSNGQIKIVSSPIGCRAPFIVTKNAVNKAFHIRYLQDAEDEIVERIKKVIDIAVNEKADIVMFPEMMASPNCIVRCAEYVQSKNDAYNPQLVLLPTCEYQKEGQWVNELVCLDADGFCVLEYHKQHPFIYEENNDQKEVYFEPICSDGVFYIIHASNVGRIGIVICSDVFKQGYLDALIKKYKITLLLHVAFSSGEDLLMRKLAVTEERMCDVVFCNTCSAWDMSEKPMSDRGEVKLQNNATISAYIPNGHAKKERKRPDDCKETKNCAGCAIITSVSRHYNDNIKEVQRKLLGT